MTPNEKTIATFETRIRQMILRFQELKQENADLRAQIAEGEQQVETLKQQLDRKQHDYDTLKMARMISITDGDLQGAKDRLARLIREVNKCIGILSDENE